MWYGESLEEGDSSLIIDQPENTRTYFAQTKLIWTINLKSEKYFSHNPLRVVGHMNIDKVHVAMGL